MIKNSENKDEQMELFTNNNFINSKVVEDDNKENRKKTLDDKIDTRLPSNKIRLTRKDNSILFKNIR